MEVRNKVIRAYLRLLNEDSHLLAVKANERSITHRFAIYIENEFPEFDVDCEFNRKGEGIKRIEGFERNTTSADTEGVSVYPDVIVHRRGTQTNFLVVEAKTTSNANDCLEANGCRCDLCKLRAYKEELGYVHAFYVLFPVGEELNEFMDAHLANYIREIP
jgi:hypothetical protein